MRIMLYGVYGGYYANVGQSFYRQVTRGVSPRDDKVYTWVLAKACAWMQDYQQRGFDYVMLVPLPEFPGHWEA